MGTQCRIRDLGSSNGTFVNGDRITDHIVHRWRLGGGGRQHLYRAHRFFRPAPAAASGPPSAPHAQAAGSRRVGEHRSAAPMATIRRLGRAFRARNRSCSTRCIAKARRYMQCWTRCAMHEFLRFWTPPAKNTRASMTRILRRPILVLVPRPIAAAGCADQGRLESRLGLLFLGGSSNLKYALRHWRPFVTLHNRNGQPLTFRFWDPRVLRAVVPAMTPR